MPSSARAFGRAASESPHAAGAARRAVHVAVADAEQRFSARHGVGTNGNPCLKSSQGFPVLAAHAEAASLTGSACALTQLGPSRNLWGICGGSNALVPVRGFRELWDLGGFAHSGRLPQQMRHVPGSSTSRNGASQDDASSDGGACRRRRRVRPLRGNWNGTALRMRPETRARGPTRAHLVKACPHAPDLVWWLASLVGAAIRCSGKDRHRRKGRVRTALADAQSKDRICATMRRAPTRRHSPLRRPQQGVAVSMGRLSSGVLAPLNPHRTAPYRTACRTCFCGRD